ncbi:MAG: potassium-transporting ATPase subunit KdpC [Actinomycetia bacterium]|nr:potassium-transporting ATPase subunit KdpC [Actinomycetes bacterium]
MNLFLKQLRPAALLLLAMVVICGLIYTAAMTGVAQLAFPHQANGSIITVTLKDGTKKDFGSALIAQKFTDPPYLIGRPMTVSNLSPTSDEQQKLVAERVQWFHDLDPGNTAPIPADLVTASGSGVDPNITPEAAEYQVARVARERKLSEDDVRAVIKKYTTKRFLGFIGEPTVNVLKVNLALDGVL